MVKVYSRRAFQIDREFNNMNSEIDLMFNATEEKISSLRDFVFIGNCIRSLYDGTERLLEMILSFSNKSATNVAQYHAEVANKVSPILNLDTSTQEQLASWRKLAHFFHHGYSFQVKPRYIATAMIELPNLFEHVAYKIIDFWDEHKIEIETSKRNLEESIKKLFVMQNEFSNILKEMDIQQDVESNVTSTERN